MGDGLMAKFKMDNVDGFIEMEMQLSKLGKQSKEVAEKMVYEGAKVVADAIKSELVGLPEENFRHLNDGDKFSGIPKGHKKDLIDGFGVTHIDVDSDGNTNAKIGFDGYGSYKTKKYPKGLPNPLLARAIESGSSVRKKNPFVRRGFNKSKEKAVKAMRKIMDEEVKKIVRGE